MEDVGDVTFELRRRLTTVTTECDALLADHSDQLAPDVEQSIEQIEDQVRQLVTLVARLETAPIADEPIRSIDADHSPHKPAPDELVPNEPIVLSLPESPFLDDLVSGLAGASRRAHVVSDPETAIAECENTDAHLVMTVRDIIEHSPNKVDAAVSLVSPSADGDPILGVSGLLAPDAPAETLTRVLDGFHGPDVRTAPVAIVGPDGARTEAAGTDGGGTNGSGADGELAAALGAAGRTVHQVGADDPVPADVECILLPSERWSDAAVHQLRQRQEGRRTPVVVLAAPPEGEWLPTVGGRTFVQRPPTVTDFTGELLLVLDT